MVYSCTPARCEIYRVFVRLPWRSRPSAPLARKKAVQRRIFTGAGLPYAYCDGNSTVRATNADRSPQLSCLLSASIVRLLSIVRSGKVGRVLDPSEPFLSFIVVVRAGPRPARLQKTLASQCSHGRRPPSCQVPARQRARRFASTLTTRGHRIHHRCPAGQRYPRRLEPRAQGGEAPPVSGVANLAAPPHADKSGGQTSRLGPRPCSEELKRDREEAIRPPRTALVYAALQLTQATQAEKRRK